MKAVVAVAMVGLSLLLLGAPTGAVAAGSLGGYNATAVSAVVRVQVFEAALPIPTSPQVDTSIGFAQSQSATGPSSRALASYLWPGDTLGDGFGSLVGDDSMTYPVKASSKFPATEGDPARSTVQLTDGNGMTASADGETTKSTVTGAEVGSNLLSGLGTGLCVLFKQKCPSAAPVTLPGVLPAVATLDSARSQSVVTLADGRIAASARTQASGLDLLGGLVTINAVDMRSSVVSDGDRATPDGAATITGLRVAGQRVDLGDPVDLGGTRTPVPHAPLDLPAIGLKIEYLTSARTADGAAGALSVAGLTITVDAAVLSKALHTNLLTGPLATFLNQIPTAGALLNGLLELGSKIVITVGDVRTAASAAPAYVGDSSGPAAAPPVAEDPGTGPGAVIDLPGVAGGPVDAGEPPTSVLPTLTAPEVAPQSFSLPGLPRTPSLLLLGALALAGLAGWLFRAFGAFFLAADNCVLGASVGVPNLRED